ncbi:MAG: 3-phosphoshikimate 1-carboxyvinyltransferase [Caloramator sp.]|nr:3-phosphoshikimate 1-carboxyvinyltransferase [Caloramator sp.]
MQRVKISPSKLFGTVTIPPSKSIAHRAIICAGLSKGYSNILNVDYSDDINATIEGMKILGAKITKNNNSLSICGDGFFKKNNDFKTINCIESGSTLRFLIPLSLIHKNKIIFIGKGKLFERPLNPYFDIFNSQKINYKFEKNSLEIEGEIKPGLFYLRGDISSQFISGLLFSLPLLKGSSRIIITTDLESKGYIDLTIDILSKFGIKIINNNYKEFLIEGNQSYMSQSYTVEGDYSQAAFYLAAGTLGSCIECRGLNVNSLQGDMAIIDIIKSMGGKVEINNDYIMAYPSKTTGTVIDGSEIPDIIPILSILSSLSLGTTNIINSKRLRFKECDRLKAISTQLKRLGADIKEKEDGLIINGKISLKGGVVDSYNDHRIAMALAIASTRCESPVIIKNSDAVKKSYPNFWSDFKNLGGKVEESNEG